MAEENDRPDEQPPETPDEAPPEEPITPDEEGRSEPVEPGEDADAPSEPEPEPEAEPEAEPEGESEPEPPPAAEAAPEPGQAAEAAPREKPEIPGADLEVDIVPEGYDPLGRESGETALEEYEAPPEAEGPSPEPAEETETEPETRPQAIIDLAADARYRATGKRKTSVARVILRPGDGKYLVNGRPLEDHFPRPTLQRNIRQPLETVGYDSRMDVVAKLHGGGVSSQAGALRHGIARALIEADPNLRSELKQRGFLTRDPRVKERKKAGLKKARKRPQFSKR
jgi:small subunit ribosomal protein S9